MGDVTGGDAVFLVASMPAPGPFELDGDEGHHAAAVRRMRPGHTLVLTDGRGSRADADVVGTARHSVTLDVGTATYEAQPALRVTVVQALPKGDRGERAVAMATEAGVDRIVPWQAKRCVVRWDGAPGKAERGRAKWHRAAAEAAKQSRRSWVPTVRPLADTDEVAHLIRDADGALVFHENVTVPLADASLPAAGDLVVVIGPEGGLAPDEVDRFGGQGARTVRLGPHVLRTSTAPAVVLGALGVLTDRWAVSPEAGEDDGPR